MCEDDLERVEMPLEGMYRGQEAKNEVAENGDLEDDIPPTPVQELDEEIKKKPQVKLKAKTPSKVKPSKTLLQFSKKKRKRSDSEGSDADLDRTPPPSPPEEESGIEKRRSGRNTKRKKYIDDVKYNFSDEDKKDGEEAPTIDDILGPDIPESTENSMGAEGEAGSGPNYAFIDPTAEDTMIVQVILASRTGTREIAEEEKKPEELKVEAKKEFKEETKDETKEDEKEEAKEEKKEETQDETKVQDNKEAIENDQGEEKEKINGAEHIGEKKEEDQSDEVKEKNQESETKSEEPEAEGNKEKASDKPAVVTNIEKPEPLKITEKPPSKTVEVEEFLVKFKNFSYLHCQWLTEEELLRGDKRVSQKIKRYLQKKSKSADMMDFCDDEPFNPDYVEVDRVLDSSVHTEDKVGFGFYSISIPLFCQVLGFLNFQMRTFHY